jgi:hypothetical protein
MTNELATFAARFSIAPSDTYVLPALFERTAQKLGMHQRVLLAEATYRNHALGEYLADAARKVAAADA